VGDLLKKFSCRLACTSRGSVVSCVVMKCFYVSNSFDVDCKVNSRGSIDEGCPTEVFKFRSPLVVKK